MEEVTRRWGKEIKSLSEVQVTVHRDKFL